MTAARTKHTATWLPSGEVLVVGGTNAASGDLDSAERFDPVTGAWTATATPMTVARQSPTATWLPSGEVLVAGGFNATTRYLDSAELFNPRSGAWTATATPMTTARSSHSAALVASGAVLVAGGSNGSGALGSAELFDPVTRTWTATAATMTVVRQGGRATTLASGRVLVTGGEHRARGLGAAELFDPAAGTWKATAAMAVARSGHTLTQLPSGKVLVAGGWTGSNAAAASVDLDTAELYEAAGTVDAWRPTVSGPDVLVAGRSTVVTGTRFRGVSAASGGGPNDSPTDLPIVGLQAVDSGRLIALGFSDFTRTSATVFVPAAVPPGPYVLWVAANALYAGRVVTVTAPLDSDVTWAVANQLAAREFRAHPVAAAGNDPGEGQESVSVFVRMSAGCGCSGEGAGPLALVALFMAALACRPSARRS